MRYLSEYTSPLGILTLECDGKHLTGLWIEEQKYFGIPFIQTRTVQNDIPVFVQTKEWLDRYFAGKHPESSELPLAPSGTPFRRKVWNFLCDIPYGTVTSYGEIAKRMAGEMGRTTMSAQAVGGAVGHNPISIIIPCHRVVGSDGSLTGYAGGIHKKIWLLQHEEVQMKGLFVPKTGTAL